MAVITNMAFIHVIVVVIRLWWFKRKLLALGELMTLEQLFQASANP